MLGSGRTSIAAGGWSKGVVPRAVSPPIGGEAPSSRYSAHCCITGLRFDRTSSRRYAWTVLEPSTWARHSSESSVLDPVVACPRGCYATRSMPQSAKAWSPKASSTAPPGRARSWCCTTSPRRDGASLELRGGRCGDLHPSPQPARGREERRTVGRAHRPVTADSSRFRSPIPLHSDH